MRNEERGNAHHRRWQLSSWLLASGLLVAGCGGSDGETAGGDLGPRLDAAADPIDGGSTNDAAPPVDGQPPDLAPTLDGGGLADALVVDGATAPDTGLLPDVLPPTDQGPAEPDVAMADVGPPDAATPPPAFPRGLIPSAELGERHGYQVARAIIHLHSIFSHDACDNDPVLPDGQPNEACLQDLRLALCTDRIDFGMLTEHYDRMAETLDFEQLFLARAGDTWVDEQGHHSANALHCPDGHVAHVMPGLEGGDGQVSPIGITGHPGGATPAELRDAYQDDSPAGVQRLRDQDAVPVAIHIEGQDPEWLATTGLDAVEIGNLHVLIAPNYREELGLDPGGPLMAFAQYMQNPTRFPAPDLVFLEVHQRLPLYHEKWDALLARMPMAGFAGNDVHRNVLPVPMGDGERPDSYRRMMKWYVNHLLVRERTPAQAREALSRGRLYMVFEVLGSPVGFDFWAEQGDGQPRVMGEVAESGGDPTTVRLRATRPRPQLDRELLDAPTALRLYRITAAGSTVVAETDGALDLAAPGPGRYRVELEITPTHLTPYLAGRDLLLRPYPWIYSNAIEVR